MKSSVLGIFAAAVSVTAAIFTVMALKKHSEKKKYRNYDFNQRNSFFTTFHLITTKYYVLKNKIPL